MAVKDFDISENKDRDKKREEERQADQASHTKFPSNTKESRTIEVKNAHASGDGSFGRNESSVPEQEPRLGQDNSVY